MLRPLGQGLSQQVEEQDMGHDAANTFRWRSVEAIFRFQVPDLQCVRDRRVHSKTIHGQAHGVGKRWKARACEAGCLCWGWGRPWGVNRPETLGGGGGALSSSRTRAPGSCIQRGVFQGELGGSRGQPDQRRRLPGTGLGKGAGGQVRLRSVAKTSGKPGAQTTLARIPFPAASQSTPGNLARRPLVRLPVLSARNTGHSQVPGGAIVIIAASLANLGRLVGEGAGITSGGLTLPLPSHVPGGRIHHTS